jgi:hypothetical protein
VSPDYSRVSLDETVAAGWRTRLAGKKGEDRAHWRTKTAYYRAAAELIAQDQPLTWRTIIAAVTPKGSRSTFYEVTGPRAKHSLVDDYLGAARTESLQVALCYRRRHAVEQLIDETKVWSYWPARQAWLDRCRQDPQLRTADGLFDVVGRWARSHPGLAAAQDYAPPACAVEDLVAISRGQLPAMRAMARVRQAMLPEGEPSEAATAGVRAAVESAFAEINCREPRLDLVIATTAGSGPDPVILRLAEQIHAVSEEMRRLPTSDAIAVREVASALLADAVSGPH